MKIRITPKSILGKLSIGLIILMPLLFYIGMSSVNSYESIPAGKTILQDIIMRPRIAIPMLAGFIFGITAFIFGVIDITRKKDYSILVFLSTLIGFLIFLWGLIEVLFPH